MQIHIQTWFIEIELFGGKGSAINAVPADATAFAHRNVRFNIQMQTLSLDGPLPETHIAYITCSSSFSVSVSTQWCLTSSEYSCIFHFGRHYAERLGLWVCPIVLSASSLNTMFTDPVFQPSAYANYLDDRLPDCKFW